MPALADLFELRMQLSNTPCLAGTNAQCTNLAFTYLNISAILLSIDGYTAKLWNVVRPGGVVYTDWLRSPWCKCACSMLARAQWYDRCKRLCRLPRENLERLLEMKLPTRSTSAQDDISGDCCICYAYRLPPAQPAGAGSATLGAHPDLWCRSVL